MDSAARDEDAVVLRFLQKTSSEFGGIDGRTALYTFGETTE
jgi:hypothetical protein